MREGEANTGPVAQPGTRMIRERSVEDLLAKSAPMVNPDAGIIAKRAWTTPVASMRTESLVAFFLTIPEAGRLIGRSKAWVWDRIRKDPDFPKPVRPYAGATLLVRSEVVAWCERTVSAHRAA